MGCIEGLFYDLMTPRTPELSSKICINLLYSFLFLLLLPFTLNIIKELLTEAETDASCDRRSDLRVIRAMVTKESCLIGKTASDVNFRAKFNAAIVAIQRRGKNVAGRLAKTSFEAGDILILQASKESSLLLQPSSNSGPNKSEECNGSTERAKLERPFSFGSPCRRAEEHAISKHDVSSVTLRKRPFFGFHKTAIKSEDPSQLVLDNKRERIRVTEVCFFFKLHDIFYQELHLKLCFV